ncbi:3-oxoacyl-ACP reductase FabG [Candidatus Pacearchaeota archaeon]|nr:3-oxoacyl-ACP reductase FabG [Candidatus Pacearchaeota archaeon]
MEQKVAIVTGATGSIGKDIAIFLSERGIKVVGTFNKKEEEAKELEALNKDIKIFHLDLSSINSIEKFVQSISESFPKIDFLVNNAGIKSDNLLENMPEEDISEVINVNLIGTIKLTKKLLPKIKESKGRIINIGSVAGEFGSGGQANYSVSKAGISAFTKTLAKELAKYGITVNNIAPGLIESEMAKTVPEKIKEKIINKIALKKLGTPRAISELVYFLVTNEGNYITGQTIRIDGGLLN